MLTTFENPYKDVKYDLKTRIAKKVLGLLSEVLNFAFSYGISIIVVVVTIITIVDIVFIVTPLSQYYFRGEDSKGIAEKGRRLWFLSKSADKAFMKAGDGTSGMIKTYLIDRLRFYFIASIVISVILMGSDFIIKFLTNMLSGILS